MVETGGHGLLTFRRQDLIIVSPGVPLDTPELVQVRKFGRPIMGELELASRFLKGKSLAITGSNGKTTTTSLCGEILTAGGLPTQVGGNIGLPVIALVDDSRDDGWSVLEVSSFQLETTEQFHPEIAVILNITPDHLDRHGNFENYVAAKERIFANQTADDALVLNADDDVAMRAAARAHSRVFWFSRTRIVRQGAFVHEGAILFRATEQSAPELIRRV
jgi:UDP-N-acetylmuramoylalanine--D-glutamate ligase